MTPPPREKLLGALLAGGGSTRFGRDKALAILHGRTLIERSADALRPHVGRLLICGRTFGELESLDDRPASGLGPLAGLNAALHSASDAGFDGVLTSGCDMPAFPADLARALVGEGAAIVEGAPVIGYWPASLAAVLDAFIDTAPSRAIWRFARAVNARSISPAGVDLPNINTPEDLLALEKRWIEPD